MKKCTRWNWSNDWNNFTYFSFSLWISSSFPDHILFHFQASVHCRLRHLSDFPHHCHLCVYSLQVTQNSSPSSAAIWKELISVKVCCLIWQSVLFLFKQEVPLHQKLYSHQSVCILHPASQRNLHQRCSSLCWWESGSLLHVNSEKPPAVTHSRRISFFFIDVLPMNWQMQIKHVKAHVDNTILMVPFRHYVDYL